MEGNEIIARLPTSLASPAQLTTASEVATLQFMQSLGIPVPRVLAYSCGTDSDVGSEYIMMERVKGVHLLSVWDQLNRKRRGHIINQLVDFESKLLALNLNGYGSIYLKRDIPETSSIPLSTDPSL